MIGKIIKYMRKSKNLKQEQLSRILNIERTTLSGYETERRSINFETLIEIADICDYEIIFKNKITKEQFKPKDLERKDI